MLYSFHHHMERPLLHNIVFTDEIFPPNLKQNVFVTRSGVGAPVVGEIDGEYHHDNRKNILEWTLPVINSENKSGSLEFSIAGSPDDFFPVNVNFFAKRTYCNIQVCCTGG